MFSRAHLLIERDWERLLNDKLWGVEAHPLKDDSIFEWTAKILGLKGTIWEGGVFRLYLKFDESFNTKPPEVCFHTIPFHPNVDMITGKPCVDFLDDWHQWVEGYSLSMVLLTIQSMLSNPVLEDAVNSDAVQMLVHHPHAYKQMVQDCVSASQRVEAGLSPHTPEEKPNVAPTNQSPSKVPARQTSSKKSAKVSFEDYFTTWTGIATSKATETQENRFLEGMKDKPTLQKAHYGLRAEDLKAQAEKEAEEQRTLIYGKFQRPQKGEDAKQAKIDKVNKMRKIYLQPRTPRRTPISLEGTRIEDAWEGEVDALVAWSQNLDDGML